MWAPIVQIPLNRKMKTVFLASVLDWRGCPFFSVVRCQNEAYRGSCACTEVLSVVCSYTAFTIYHRDRFIFFFTLLCTSLCTLEHVVPLPGRFRTTSWTVPGHTVYFVHLGVSCFSHEHNRCIVAFYADELSTTTGHRCVKRTNSLEPLPL